MATRVRNRAPWWTLPLALLGACRETATASSAPEADASSPLRSVPTTATTPDSTDAGACASLFEPPPGATPLCDKNDRGNLDETHWHSFGTTEPRAVVNERYRALVARCGAGVAMVTKPPLFSIEQGPLRLETFERDGFLPHCSAESNPEHATIVLITAHFPRKWQK